ncbi:hypothetical protein FRC10_001472 [Ceratobasidium sp. 414]|nr:hypothetical protein FRC10_001472 [Ceratobasidium sp. 414]
MAERSFIVLYFAAARTATGIHKDVIKIDPSSTGVPLSQLASLLSERYPDTTLGEVLEMSSWSVNEEMVNESDVPNVILTGGEEVGVICPVSGG